MLIFVARNNTPMLYRKLPNTDQSRYSALKAMVGAMHSLDEKNIPISSKLLMSMQKTFRTFDKVMDFKEQTRMLSIQKSDLYQKMYKKAHLYVSHYYQMMNMAIARGELPTSIRTSYGLSADNTKIPRLQNEIDLIRAARQLFENDAKRISTGGKYLTNPGVGVVKVWFDKFFDLYQEQQNMHHVKDVEVENIEDLRIEADTVIKALWNETETAFIDLPEEERREECEKFGLVYVFSKSEIEKKVEPDFIQQNQTIPNKEEDIFEKKSPETKESKLQFSFSFPE